MQTVQLVSDIVAYHDYDNSSCIMHTIKAMKLKRLSSHVLVYTSCPCDIVLENTPRSTLDLKAAGGLKNCVLLFSYDTFYAVSIRGCY